MSDELDIIRLCGKSTFKPEDLVTLRNLYHRYIDSRAGICLSCPSGLRHYINTFKLLKNNMLQKIQNED